MDLVTINLGKKQSAKNLEKSLKKFIQNFRKTDLYNEKRNDLSYDLMRWEISLDLRDTPEVIKLKEILNIKDIQFFEINYEASGVIYFTEEYFGFRHMLGDFSKEKIFTEIHCNLDNETPEKVATVQKILMTMGARDVWIENIIMKKSRPAVKLCILIERENTSKFICWILENTETLGLRYNEVHRLETYKYKTGKRAKIYYKLDGKKRTKEEWDYIEKKYNKKAMPD
ncbi:MAG: LarC family nickel insertion protein [Spirochaetia bacterium]|nr:LarC family nickel insertion protein [Spirochaetia bacterium]